MNSYCGANCPECGYGKKAGCHGCVSSGGCPFGEQCFIAKYIRIGGTAEYERFVRQTADEFNALNIPGMPKVTELFPVNGTYVNLAYPLPNKNTVKLLSDSGIYLGNQVECEFSDGEARRCFGLVADMNFLLVAEYGENGYNPELLVYKKR